MTTELTTTERKFTDEELKLITNTVARGATPEELKLFLYRCKSMGLDPLRPGFVHFIKYGSSPGTIVTGVDGFRAIAHRSGKLAGIKRGAIKNDQGELVGAWAEVYRSDWTHPAREEIPRSEYDTGKGTWAKLPETMLKKVAECAALRMAFPNDLGGVYESAEMDQAANPIAITDAEKTHVVNSVRPFIEQTTIAQMPPDGKYRIDFGKKYLDKTFDEVGADNLKSYINFIETDSKKNGRPITGKAAKFIELAEVYVGTQENSLFQGSQQEDIPFDFAAGPQ